MLPRFLAPTLDTAYAQVTLPPDESHHLARVLRLVPGDEVAVFDGRGREFRARVSSVSRDGARVTLLEAIAPVPEPRTRFTLVQAVLKADAMDEVVRDAVMMGAAAIVPVISTHVTVRHSALAGTKAVDRWRRVVLASVKQCRRATLPSVEPPQAFDDWLSAGGEDLRLLLVEPSAPCRPRSLRPWLAAPAPAGVTIVVGPEGGWSAEEISRATTSGCVPVTLGPLTLRADAVPVAALAVCRFVWEVTEETEKG